MNVLIGCEFSAVVRDAFRRRGVNAWSCDLEPCDGDPLWHYQMDIFEALKRQPWDLMVAHPPCTHLSVSGARHFKAKQESGVQQEALDFVRKLMAADVPKIAIENPISIISSRIRKPDQIIQPWQFGHPETKATCLWLKGLPLLQGTDNVYQYMLELPVAKRHRIHRMPPGPGRAKERAKTFDGIAIAMSYQWGPEVTIQELMQ